MLAIRPKPPPHGYSRMAFFVLGAGGTIRYDRNAAQAGPHLFVGVAWPLSKNGYQWCVEPYYRPAFLFDRCDGRFKAAHEIGILFKFATQRAHYTTCGE